MKIVKFSYGIMANDPFNINANFKPVCISKNENGAIVSIEGNVAITGSNQSVETSLSLKLVQSINYEYNKMYFDPNANSDDPGIQNGINDSWYAFAASQKGNFKIENIHVPCGYTLFIGNITMGSMFRCLGVEY